MDIHRCLIFLILGTSFGWSQPTFQGMNPNIGVIGDFLYQDHLDGSGEESGFQFSEAELSFRMVLDPFARADFFIAIVPPEEAVELEEGYITVFSLPFSLQARIGRFRPAFGKFNLTHPPETPLATPPLFLTRYFGEEGLAETGISFSALVANPWEHYMEASLSILNGDNDVSFSGGMAGTLSYLLHLKDFLDLSENSSVELGFSTMIGPNDPGGDHSTRLLGADATYRWKPLAMGRYRSFTLQSEFLHSQRETSYGVANSYAFFLFSQVQLARRWFGGLSFDHATLPNSQDDFEQRLSGILTFWPSEFQTIKLQVLRTGTDSSWMKGLTSFYFQWTFIIGAHGAHKF